MRWPCDTRVLRNLVDEALTDALGRGARVETEELSAKAVNAVSQAVLDGQPLTDVELSAILSAYVGNRCGPT